MSCQFCILDSGRMWIESEHAIAFADAYPVTDVHSIVISRQHTSTIYELSAGQHQQYGPWLPKSGSSFSSE